MNKSFLKTNIVYTLVTFISFQMNSCEYLKYESHVVDSAAKNFNLTLGATAAASIVLGHGKIRSMQPALCLTTFTALSNAWVSHKKINAVK